MRTPSIIAETITHYSNMYNVLLGTSQQGKMLATMRDTFPPASNPGIFQSNGIINTLYVSWNTLTKGFYFPMLPHY